MSQGLVVVLLVLAGAYSLVDFFQGEECPDCRALRLRFRAHRDPGAGGASFAYFACTACGARLRQRPDGPLEAVDPAEWAEVVGA